jgi:hypothetical protein
MINHALKQEYITYMNSNGTKHMKKMRERQLMLVTEFTPPGLHLQIRFNWNTDHFNSFFKRCWDLLISDYIRDSFSFNEDSRRLLTLIPLHTSRRIIPYMNKSLNT